MEKALSGAIAGKASVLSSNRRPKVPVADRAQRRAADLASGQRPDVGGLRALLAFRHLELDALGLGQGLETAALDLRIMREEVLAAVIGGDEAEALALVEPLDDASL